MWKVMNILNVDHSADSAADEISEDDPHKKAWEQCWAHLHLVFKSYDLGCRDVSVYWANRQKNPCG